MIINGSNLATLNVAFNAAFREGFGQAPKDHEAFTLDVPSMTAEEEYGWLGQFPGMREWIGERVLRDIATHGYRIRNRKFESTISVKRDDIEDDRVGLYAPLFREMGMAAAAHPCEMVYEVLRDGFDSPCYDGQYMFDTDHPVVDEDGDTASHSNVTDGTGTGEPWFLLDTSRALKPVLFQRRRDYRLTHMDQLTDEHVFMKDEFRHGVDARVASGYGLWQLAHGARAPLTAAAYETARQQMRSIRGDQGRVLGIRPNVLLVGPQNEKEGLEILNAERLENGATNVWRNSATLLVSDWLATS